MKYLTADPTIASGHLVIKGTRIRISHILRLLAEGTTLEEIQKEWYPWLALRTLRGAVNEIIKQMETTTSVTSHA